MSNTPPEKHRFNRRDFVHASAGAALGLGILGCTPATRKTLPRATAVRVQILGASEPDAERAFSMLQRRIEERCHATLHRVQQNPDLVLQVDPALAAEAFEIRGTPRKVTVASGSARGLTYGIGKFLRTSRYDNGFTASSWRGHSEPVGTLRGMYFASHFHNWYVQASDAEITRYMEDMSLWGINALKLSFPMINLHGWEDPETQPALEMLRKYARAARPLGIQFGIGINNTMFIDAPDSIRAKPLPDPTGRRGNSGHPVCPSNSEGHTYLIENADHLFKRLSDVGLDFLVFWPYDEGGCACDRCSPWGSRGYLKLSRDFAAIARGYFPKLKTVLSTWMFDTPPEGEWQGLTVALGKGEPWLDYILADSHEDFPRHPLDKGVPGGRPLLNFPEISMWGNWPWGGVGANPLPSRFQRLWDQVKPVVRGGFPYSEGIYEDMNKAVVAQFYWDPERSARSTLEEYIAYEFSPTVTAEALELVDLLESAASNQYRKQPVDKPGVSRAFQLAESIHQRLPLSARNNWRWEIVHLRAILDRERYVGGSLESPEAEAALLRLMELYHCQIETDDPYHHRVRPPLKRAVNRSGKK